MDMFRFEQDWSGLKNQVTRRVHTPGPVLIITVLFMTLACLNLFTGLSSFQYRPSNGIVGLPLLLDYPPGQELFCYLGSLFSGILFHYLILYLISLSGRPVLVSRCLACLAAAFFVSSMLMFPTHGSELFVRMLKEPTALAQLLILFLVLGYLTSINPSSGRPGAMPGTVPSPGLTGKNHVLPAEQIQRSCLLFFYLMLVFSIFLPNLKVSALLAAPLAWFLEGLLRSPCPARKHAHVSVFLENTAWILMLLFPLIGWIGRLRLTLGHPFPGPRTMILVTLGTVALLICSGIFRKRSGFSPRFKILALIPALLLGMILLGSGSSDRYDAFHQGEFIYPARALLAGLNPWESIFYVHGFGINTLFGLLMGEPSIPLHSLDNTLYSALAGISLAIIAGILTRLWGGDWWLTILALCLCCLLATGPLGARYLFIWIQLGLILNFIRKQRLRWLFAASIVACLNLFYSLDTGAAACVCGLAWCVVWDWGHNQKMSRMGRLLPGRCTAAYVLGLLLAITLGAIVLLSSGILDDFITVHWEYLKMKHHYDKLPLEPNSAAFLVSPVISFFGICSSIRILLKRQFNPLSGSIILLTFLSIVCFARGLDRADSGHLIYATSPSWILAGSLLVRRRGPEPDPETAAAQNHPSTSAARKGAPLCSFLFALLLSLYPACNPLLTGGRGHEALAITPLTCLKYLMENRDQPFCRPIRDTESIKFFDLCSKIRSDIPSHEKLYDFSNQPAVYAWTGRIAPTRFFTSFYTAPLHWQSEVVDQLSRKNVRHIIWRGPSTDWNYPDGIPNYLRQWWIARHVLRNYRPSGIMPGNSLLLESPDNANWPEGNGPNHKDLFTNRDRKINLHEMPRILGEHGGSGFPLPDRVVTVMKGRPDSMGQVSLKPVDPGQAMATDEIWITFPDPNPAKRAALSWEAGNSMSPSTRFEVVFTLDEGTPGPYRIPLSCMPGWVWTAQRKELRAIKLDVPGTDYPVDIELRAYPDSISQHGGA